MIDARVDDAVKQHLQKMDWLHREEEAQTLTPPPAGATGTGGKMGFTLPLNDAPQAHEVIAPGLEIVTKQKGDGIPLSSDTEQSVEGNRTEATTAADCLVQPAASTDEDDKKTKEDKTGSSPPKDGTPV